VTTKPTALPNPVNTADVERIVERLGTSRDRLIPLLRAVQDEYGFLPEEALLRLADLTELTPADISGVATFYTLFRHRPAGCHTIGVCVGTACHVKGAEAVYREFLRELKIPPGDDTDPDRQFTVEKVACLGCCTLAPAVQIEDAVYGHVHPPTVPRVLADFLENRSQGATRKRARRAIAEPPAGEIRLGLGSCCQARGSKRVLDAVEDALDRTGRNVIVKHVGCVGICSQTPLVEIVTPDNGSTIYTQVEPEDARRIVLRHFRPAGVLRRLRSAAPTALDRLYAPVAAAAAGLDRHEANVRDPAVELEEFLRPQINVATERCGELDPVDLPEYERGGGFEALRRLQCDVTAEQVIDTVTASGLRGRGGAGYPTGLKWRQVKQAPATTKYVVCNGDEGDPGAFMDRMLLESYPFRVLEGVAVAAHTVGAHEAILYIRAEYPLALQRVREAIAKMEQAGYLGAAEDGTPNLHIRIVEGAGAFVCGEETALLASIEGRRGMPRMRPPFPAESGLWGCPTLVNNVETFANIPWIICHGAEAFAAMGAEHSRGTKVFALAGKIVRGGLIEVPMGIPLRDVVEVIGGGVAEGRTFKAAQIGGPSGGCVPAKLADTPIDYEALSRVGAIMGSGGIVVLDNTDCMVDIAKYFLEFTQAQSCGRCAPCRIGTRRMLDILEQLCAGNGRAEDIDTLEELAHMIKRTSLCGLGQTAPNPVLSTLTHFREEYEAHINGTCPAAKCTELITFTITDRCIGCTRCAQRCPVDAIPMNPLEQHTIDQTRCVKCGSCRETCPVDAVEVK
jgi:NADH:ubiquinone oxidoreductase subunit F (NADH-binding)/NADH:ubiquinone oxidoreductase subunit E/Pyruvate/2-oxoacid:ferredoxin oxidoreductase delta subunit